MKRLFSKIKKIFVASILFVLILFIVSENIIGFNKKLCFNNIDDVPLNKVGMVFGTSKNVGKKINYYYKYRIDATFQLYKNKKIKYILVSGDNSESNYNEPQTFKNDLIKRGIPASKIYLDYAGFRTFDSVIRSKEIFGQKKITFISQQFQNERAIFIAKNNGIDAVAFNAKSLHGKFGLKTRIRERFARIKAILDVYVLKTKPKFLGNKVVIK